MWISIIIRAPIPLFLSLLISWVVGAVLTAVAYKMGWWKKKSIVDKDKTDR